MVGLVKAVDRSDPAYGWAFSTFAVPTITGELRRHFRDHTWAVRVPRRLKDNHLVVKNGADELMRQHLMSDRPADGLPTTPIELTLPGDGAVAGLLGTNSESCPSSTSDGCRNDARHTARLPR